MKLHSNSFERILLLFLFQVCFQYSACQDWSFSIPVSVQALKGSCVEIPCTFTHPTNYGEIRLIWYLYHFTNFPQVFNQKNSSAELPEYRGRTSLVGNAPNSCTLRINNVIKGDWYYPGISTRINSWFTNNKIYVEVRVTESANEPLLEEAKDLTEGVTVTISCSVEHTCHSNPPSLEWNKIGHRITLQHDDFRGGKWRYVSKLQYNPSYKDDKTQLECKVIYPNKQTKKKGYMLNIKYPPKNTTISILENKKIKEGDNVTLSCNSQGNPEVYTYKWFKDGVYGDFKEHGKMITLQNVSWVNETYYCSAMNVVGHGDSPQTVLPVEYSAKDVQITQETAHEGEEEVMKLVCRFSYSNPNPEKYTWYIDGTVIENETGQNISNMRQPGSYTCVAHNEAGNSSSSPFVIAPVTETKTNEDMTVILGSVAGLIMLMLLVFLVYIYFRLRRKLEHKSTSTSNRIMETNVNRATIQDELHMDEHLYGNVQSESIYNNTSDPGYNGMQNSQDKDVDIDTLYSKINKKKEKEDINYASVQHNAKRDTKDLSQIEETEYAVVQH